MHQSIVHKESVKIKEEPLTCETEINAGSEKAQFICEFCDSEFETEIILNHHISSYSQKSHLKTHLESVHVKKKFC